MFSLLSLSSWWMKLHNKTEWDLSEDSEDTTERKKETKTRRKTRVIHYFPSCPLSQRSTMFSSFTMSRQGDFSFTVFLQPLMHQISLTHQVCKWIERPILLSSSSFPCRLHDCFYCSTVRMSYCVRYFQTKLKTFTFSLLLSQWSVRQPTSTTTHNVQLLIHRRFA